MNDFQLNRRQDRNWNILFTVIALLSIAVFVVMSMMSCSPTKRIGGLASKHPDAALAVCVRMFPPKVETVTDTRYLPGRIDTLPGETFYVDCDSVIHSSKLRGENIVRIKRVAVPCPPSTHRVDSVFITKTITVTNTAKEQLLTKENTDLTADNDRLKKGRSTWRWIALGALLLIVGGAVLKIMGKVKLF